jgi:hypothetical protein
MASIHFPSHQDIKDWPRWDYFSKRNVAGFETMSMERTNHRFDLDNNSDENKCRRSRRRRKRSSNIVRLLFIDYHF